MYVCMYVCMYVLLLLLLLLLLLFRILSFLRSVCLKDLTWNLTDFYEVRHKKETNPIAREPRG